MLLQGRTAARVRRQAAELLVRYLGPSLRRTRVLQHENAASRLRVSRLCSSSAYDSGGDISLVDEVCRLRGLQEDLAVEEPDHPMRAFGEAVEAASGSVVATQLARACTDALALALPDLLDRLTAHIDERLAHDRQRVNLNVRAPKRARDPDISRDISGAGRVLPIAKFLDEKERHDPAWKAARRSFAPSFGIIAQVLKKQKLRADGGQPPIYVEQNHRAQILYVEEDRELLELAWVVSAAHRDELVSRLSCPAAPAALPAPQPAAAPPPPSVLDMLMRGSA